MAKTINCAYSTSVTLDLLPATAAIDRLTLWRVLRNLMCNALEAAGPSGHIAVRLRTIEHYAYVEIADDGPGLGAAKSSGNSLGLGIVRDAVAEVGGRIDLGTGDLGGCQVRMLLPGLKHDQQVRQLSGGFHDAGGYL
jgi:signal transduction histidine kinase